MISKEKIIKWMENSIKQLENCIEISEENNFDDQHSWGCTDIQNILIKKIKKGDFD